jgi:DNA-binding HxlR family transcriptional regulator
VTPISILSRRWGPEILLELAPAPRRFNQLMNALKIADRQVSVRLRELEDLGLVARHVDAGPPVRVTYQLTDAGQRLVPALRALQEVELAS